MLWRAETFMKVGIPLWVVATSHEQTFGVVLQMFAPGKWSMYWCATQWRLFSPFVMHTDVAWRTGAWHPLMESWGYLLLWHIWACSNESVMAGLALCGIMVSTVSTASDLTQDFKTWYPTLASLSPMFVNQLIGTSWVIYWQLSLWLFYKAFDCGNKATYTIVFPSMA